MNNLRTELEQRGFLYQFTDEKLFEKYGKWGKSFYLGIDPSADSLQLGNLCAIMAAVQLMNYGNTCYFLIGGATGMIGDPSGKDAERNFLWEEQLRTNEEKITHQVSSFLEQLKKQYGLDFEYTMVNNYNFYKDMWVLDFWSQVGQYITVNSMASKESVKKRLQDHDKSISYTEFSYMLIQGYDFVKLCQDNDVYLQLWGSDQWGNITTGIEIARKKLNKEVYGLTIPIITDSTGKKFGKSEGNAIWLDPAKNSPYFVYQYFLNTNDEDVEKFLKILTLYSLEEIKEIAMKHMENTSERYGQKCLARYVVALIFGVSAVGQVEKISEILFGREDKMGVISGMSAEELVWLGREIGEFSLTEDTLTSPSLVKEGEKDSFSIGVLALFTQAGLTASNSEARKMIKAGGIYCNEEKITDENMQISEKNFVDGVVLLRKGKKNFRLVRYK